MGKIGSTIVHNRFFHFLTAIWLFTGSILLAEEPPGRIISLAPNITEMIFKLGAGDLLIGRTEFCLYPKAALDKPSVGGYLNPDYEKMVALQPDMIFMLPNGDMEGKLNLLGLKTFTLSDETVEEVLQALSTLGDMLNRKERAAQVVQGIQDTLRRVQEQSASRESVSALLLVGREAGSLKGLYAAGQRTYLSEILKLCNGRNVFADAPLRYFDVAKEDLLRRNPQAIIEFRIIDGEKAEAEVAALKADWEALPTLKALQNRHIFILTERFFLIPGPRISQMTVTLHQVLQQVTP